MPSNKIGKTLQPVFTSRRTENDDKMREEKPPLINQQIVEHETSFSSFAHFCVENLPSNLIYSNNKIIVQLTNTNFNQVVQWLIADQREELIYDKGGQLQFFFKTKR